MSIKVSVIIPVYNAATCLEQAILSVLTQNFTAFELIVIDGGSMDGTVDLIRKYEKHISYWHSKKDQGIYDGMNMGIVKASGQYLLFLGADDTLHSPQVLAGIFQNPLNLSYDMIYGDVLLKTSQASYDGEFDLEKLREKNICHQAIFYSKELFEKKGLFDLRWKVLADWDFNLKLFTDKKIRKKYIPLLIAVFNDKGISGDFFETGFYSYKNNLIDKYLLPWYSFKKIKEWLKKTSGFRRKN